MDERWVFGVSVHLLILQALRVNKSADIGESECSCMFGRDVDAGGTVPAPASLTRNIDDDVKALTCPTPKQLHSSPPTENKPNFCTHAARSSLEL
jgi:hypothetical protein